MSTIILLIPTLLILAIGIHYIGSFLENLYYAKFKKVLTNQHIHLDYVLDDSGKYVVYMKLATLNGRRADKLNGDEIRNLLSIYGFYHITDICLYAGHATHYKFEKWFVLKYVNTKLLEELHDAQT